MDIREGTIEANGIRLGFLEAGEGPLVVLLHGFPDNAWTWSHQIPSLAEAGYHVVAPFLRGHPPTTAPVEPFDTETLTEDTIALIEAFDEGPARVVGHDWGALATYNTASFTPGSVDRAVAIAVGHPRTAIQIFKHPDQLHYAFHVWLFQVEGFSEFAIRENGLALVDYLWNHWSTQPVDEEHVARVKESLSGKGVIEGLLPYYRGLVRVPSQKPEFFEQATQPTKIPMLVVFGADDPARTFSENEAEFFEGPYRRVLIDGAGHFVQREKPEELNRLLIEWLRIENR